MFGFSMIQMVRSHAHKLDGNLRESILNLYKPFKWTPCIFHKLVEKFIKKTRKFSVIIEFQKDCCEEGFHEVNKALNGHMRCSMRHNFSRISCYSADVTPKGLEEILSSTKLIKKIYLNRKVNALLDVAVESANAKNVVRNTTLTGEGTTIAVIDTGVYPHEDLSGRIVDFVDFINERKEAYDDNGHGTHCAGDAAGDGAASNGNYAGPAPKANVIGVKVLDKIGSGSLETVMQGVDWCIQYNESDHPNKIDIISMSLGSEPQRFETENEDPMVKYVEKAWEAGIVVCVAAGNSGPDPKTIASPGISNKVITVGALDNNGSIEREDDDVASFSSRGPTIYGEGKPDILAPGVNIVSLRSPGSYLDKLQKSSRVENDYFVLSGTSMATPICAGIVALMKQHNPSLTPLQVKEMLMNGTDLWTKHDPNIYGAGYINAENSIPL